jgi:hypothetical protein
VHLLNDYIESINNILNENGYAIIAVPNYLSWDANYYKSFWAAYDVPRHLYHFSPETIKKLFINSGFNFIKSLPMKMDAYYVSMLSEKYKGGTFQLPKAFIAGFRSNLNAWGNPEKYSSVIYIFKKTTSSR